MQFSIKVTLCLLIDIVADIFSNSDIYYAIIGNTKQVWAMIDVEMDS